MHLWLENIFKKGHNLTEHAIIRRKIQARNLTH